MGQLSGTSQPFDSPQLIVIADDLTGASDTGIAFGKAGLKTVVSIQSSEGEAKLGAASKCDVMVISTHSRHLQPDEAYTKVSKALAPFAKGSGPLPWLYKKIDSTLRGHPGPELQATLDALSIGTPASSQFLQKRLLVAPAFPAQGRTTIGGQQLVHGQPLAETSFGDEVPISDVATLFASLAPEYPLHQIDLATIRRGVEALDSVLGRLDSALFIADAETEADLQTLADTAVQAGIRLYCGSAGLANALTQTLELQPRVPTKSPSTGALHQPISPASGPMLTIAGSRHPQTAHQIETLLAKSQDKSHGFDVAHLQPASIKSGLIQDELNQALDMLGRGTHLVISTAGLALEKLGGQEVANRLGAFAGTLLAEAQAHSIPIGGLFLTGGDVAMATCLALESTALQLHGEVESGIPFGELADGPYAGLRVVTKAGGFGSAQVLDKARQLLTNAEQI